MQLGGKVEKDETFFIKKDWIQQNNKKKKQIKKMEENILLRISSKKFNKLRIKI